MGFRLTVISLDPIIPHLQSDFHSVRGISDADVFDRIIEDYYDDFSKPDKFTVVKYLKEVQMSYRLLFGDNPRAHRYYRGIAHGTVSAVGLFDPYLDELCKSSSSFIHSTNSYSTKEDFPILGPRLLELQRHILQQNSGSIMMLWRDRRDMLRW